MRLLIVLSVLFTIVLLFWIVGTLYAVKSLEEPKYSVIENSNLYEIRQYEDYLVAQVEVAWNQQQALNQGFRALAGYIFWGNTRQESISMTAPVSDIQSSSEKIAMTVPVSDISDGDKHIVQFSLPSTYTLETLPRPDNTLVELKKVTWYKAAVLRYTGWATETKVTSKKQQLSKLLEKAWIEIISDMNSAQYNPPFSFPFLRRNEIIVKIK
jgi:hypothetical protein